MSTSLLRCPAIPSDARLKNFDVFGNYSYDAVWSNDSGRLMATLREPLRFVLIKYDVELVVKPGFRWDGGSVPRWQWVMTAPPFGTRFDLAFLLHDVIYAAQIFPRSQCDWVLLEFQQELGVCWYTRNKVWIAVRIGGGYVWAEHTTDSVFDARNYVDIIIIHPNKN